MSVSECEGVFSGVENKEDNGMNFLICLTIVYFVRYLQNLATIIGYTACFMPKFKQKSVKNKVLQLNHSLKNIFHDINQLQYRISLPHEMSMTLADKSITKTEICRKLHC